MAIKEDEVKSGRLVYSCNCGWIDTGHANPNSTQAFTGARHLWEQISKELGPRSNNPNAIGFRVIYAQEMGIPVFGHVLLRNGVTNKYFVKSGLSVPQQESVALAMFLEVSAAFETYQGRTLIAARSSFSQEDLISDLIGFYRAVRPELDYKGLCEYLGSSESLEIFNSMSSSDRSAKSMSWNSPTFYPCKYCSKAMFPADFKTIVPAKKDGKDPLFRDWTLEDDFGPSPLKGKIIIIIAQNHSQGHLRGLATREDIPKVRPQTSQGKNMKV